MWKKQSWWRRTENLIEAFPSNKRRPRMNSPWRYGSSKLMYLMTTMKSDLEAAVSFLMTFQRGGEKAGRRQVGLNQRQRERHIDGGTRRTWERKWRAPPPQVVRCMELEGFPLVRDGYPLSWAITWASFGPINNRGTLGGCFMASLPNDSDRTVHSKWGDVKHQEAEIS